MTNELGPLSVEALLQLLHVATKNPVSVYHRPHWATDVEFVVQVEIAGVGATRFTAGTLREALGGLSRVVISNITAHVARQARELEETVRHLDWLLSQEPPK